MSEYDDRLDPSVYEGDEPVGVGPNLGDENYDSWSWIPERLFQRIQYLARAYELHVLSELVNPANRTVLVREQVQGLIGEADFLTRVIADAAVRAQLAVLRRSAASALSRGRGDFVIEGP